MQFAYIVSCFLGLLLGFDVFSAISYANKYKCGNVCGPSLRAPRKLSGPDMAGGASLLLQC
jgi:hypothetical protein